MLCTVHCYFTIIDRYFQLFMNTPYIPSPLFIMPGNFIYVFLHLSPEMYIFMVEVKVILNTALPQRIY